jgi:hypothetical protein
LPSSLVGLAPPEAGARRPPPRPRPPPAPRRPRAGAGAGRGRRAGVGPAVGVGQWAYDASPIFNKDAVKINQAMLKAMNFSRKTFESSKMKNGHFTDGFNPFLPIKTTDNSVTKDAKDKRFTNKLPADFNWLLK